MNFAFLNQLTKSRFFKFGLPFFILMIGGSVGLREFTQLRYKYSKKKLITPEEAAQLSLQLKKPDEFTLETEYEKLKQVNLDNWENIRGPRPWEEPTETK